MPKLKRRIKADAPPGGDTPSRFEMYPGVDYEQDEQVHAPKAPDAKAPAPSNPDKGFLKEPETKANDDDMILTQPIKYVVDSKDAIEKMEALTRKVVESRPELAPQVAVVDQALQQLEQVSQGGGAAAPAPVAPATPAFDAGDRVTVALEDGTYQGQIERLNEDGTFTVRTDQSMTLSNVPAESITRAEVTTMTLPASKRLPSNQVEAARLVTDTIAKAFVEGKKRRVANTSTDGRTIWLHNNAIARKTGDGGVEISLAGWPTVTTRERLNGLMQALGINKRVTQKGGNQLLDGQPWDGDWTNVGSVDAAEATPEKMPMAVPELAARRRPTVTAAPKAAAAEPAKTSEVVTLEFETPALLKMFGLPSMDLDEPFDVDVSDDEVKSVAEDHGIQVVDAEGQPNENFDLVRDAIRYTEESAYQAAYYDRVVAALEQTLEAFANGNSYEYQAAFGDEMESFSGTADGIEPSSIQVGFDKTTFRANKDLAHIINDVIEGVGMFAADLDPAEVTAEDLKASFGNLSMYWEVYGERAPQVDVDNLNPNFDRKELKQQLTDLGLTVASSKVKASKDLTVRARPKVRLNAAEPVAEPPAPAAPSPGAEQWFVVSRSWSDGNDARPDSDVLVKAKDSGDALEKVIAEVQKDFKEPAEDEDGDDQDHYFMWYHDVAAESPDLDEYVAKAMQELGAGSSAEDARTRAMEMMQETGEYYWTESYSLNVEGPFADEAEAKNNASTMHGTPWTLEAGASIGTGEGRIDMIAGKSMGKKPPKEVYKRLKAEAKAKRIKAAPAVAERPAGATAPTTETFSGPAKAKAGYEPTGVKIVEEGGNPRLFDPAKDDVQPAELLMNDQGQLGLANPTGQTTYEDQAGDPLEQEYWKLVKSLAPAPKAAEPVAEPQATDEGRANAEKWAKKAGVKASAKAVADEARAKIKAKKKVKASAFDEIEEIEIGGGFKARRKAKKGEGAGQDEETLEIEVVDADGKVKDTFPDAFGDDTVMIIKFLRQVLDIKEGDDKAAAKSEAKDGGESGIAEKPKALPATKGDEPKDDKKDEEETAKNMEARLETIRGIAGRLLRAGHIQASIEDVDNALMAGKSLTEAQAVAAKKAVDRKVMDLLAQPEEELLIIRASLPHLEARRVTVPASEGGLAPINLSASGVIDVSGKHDIALGAAFGRGFRR